MNQQCARREVWEYVLTLIAMSYSPDCNFSDDFWYVEGGEERSVEDRGKLLEAANKIMDEINRNKCAGECGMPALEHQITRFHVSNSET